MLDNFIVSNHTLSRYGMGKGRLFKIIFIVKKNIIFFWTTVNIVTYQE